MTKIDTLRRFILPCFAPPLAAPAPAPAKKRISTSLRDYIYDDPKIQEPNLLDLGRLRKGSEDVEDDGSDAATGSTSPVTVVPPRPSKTMVIGTIFGPRRGHVWFCVQHDRLSTKPSLLLELSIPTQQLVKEMQSSELVRIALECSADSEPGLGSCPLRSVPVWTLSCNGRKLGFATRRKASEQNRSMLKTMQSMTVGAGVIPSGTGSALSEEIMYMRANYEHVVGSADSESFHLINPDECPGQELSLFLLRTR
ncbi:hypothetical protein BT93_L3822 [Corymbia citriodora subsp. variegata]|uniref:Protein MIZU-KUSSEI 1 n=1 Tax=Corymbia citriodora subsp. variegata TaxID=360336 RepID=A0A8T0CV30_CORYI|nr:hypothetical protein BT93_L3822 [Corymbia citriodora subsp. variegata]